MNFALSDEQQALKQSARDFLGKECPISLVRELQEAESSGHSSALWQKMAELGWLGLAFPEASGGVGASLLDLAVLYEQAGRALVPTTLYSTIAAGLVVLNCARESQQQEVLPRVASGELIMSLALSEPSVSVDPGFLQTTAKLIGDSYVLDGTKMFVQNAHLAGYLLVVARTDAARRDEAISIFLVEGDAPGLTLRPMLTFGRDRQSEVHFDGVRVPATSVLGQVGRAWPGLALALEQVTALQCVEMVGGAQIMLDKTVEYLRHRIQFDRPIGSFQAPQHHAANMAIDVDGARFTAYRAVARLSKWHRARREVAVAKAVASEAYKRVSLMAHQLHAGIGYAREYDLHLWSGRAKATELSLGTYDHHLETVAEEMGL